MTFDPNFDPAQLAEDAIKANLDPYVFEQVNEQDIARPRNVFEWVYGRNFLNLRPFPKQVEITANVLSDFCPKCTDPKYLDVDENFGTKRLLIDTAESIGNIQDGIQFLEHGLCPKCDTNRLELQKAGLLAHYLDLAAVCGMRASKSVISGGLLATYQLARYLGLPSPSRYFRLLDNQMLHGTFVALTAGQAYDTLWQAFKDRIEGSPWFRTYHDFLDSEGQRLSKELYDIKDTFLWYGHKQLSWSFCGPDIRTIRGRTRIYTSVDELSWFDAGAEGSTSRIRLNARETSHALVKALQTIRAASMTLREEGEFDAPDGLNADISSPCSINDTLMQKLRESNTNATIYGVHYATWEMNPNIPLSSLKTEMLNPQEFERDYGAVPPLGANQFISAQAAVLKCQRDKPQDLVSWSYETLVDSFGDKSCYLKVSPRVRDKSRPRIITVDTGFSNNSYAVAMWSYDRENRVPVCDVVLECAPKELGHERVPVNFPAMYENCIEPLCRSFHVIMAAYDRWNSLDSIQRLRRDHKVEALPYQVKWADFTAIRARILESQVSLPKSELTLDDVRKSKLKFEDVVRQVPATHQVLQILTVREVGRKVIKPLNGTDDLFRCLCLAVTFITDPKYTTRFERYGGIMAHGVKTVGSIRSNRTGATTRVGVGTNSLTGVRRSFRGKL